MKKDAVKFILFALILVALVVTGWMVQPDDIGIQQLRAQINSFGYLAGIVFILIYAVAVILLLPASLFTVLAGALFGYTGIIYVAIGATSGATVAFLLARYLGEPFVARVLTQRLDGLHRYNKRLEQYGFGTVLFLRLIPLFPFNVLNIGLGLTKVRLFDYVAATAIGILPGAFVYAFLGRSIAALNVLDIIIAGVLVILLALLYPVYRMVTSAHNGRYDIIIIGAGAAGLNIASFMNKAGFRVLLVSRSEEEIGGDCLNTGCVPSKALIHAARHAHAAQEASRFGFHRHGETDWAAVKDYIDEKQDIIRTHENASYLRDQGIDVVIGDASFHDKRSVVVNHVVYSGRNIVIATGSQPRVPRIEGLEQVADQYTNETIFDIGQFPHKLVVIGGGPIGCEVGQAFNDLGAQVTIIDQGDRLLSKEDPVASARLLQTLRAQGVTVKLNTDTSRFPSSNTVVLKENDGRTETLSFDAVFLATGRGIDFSSLNLKAAGIRQHEDGRLVLDRALRTTNRHVYAAGDAAGGLQFTHAAELHAQVIIRNFFKPWRARFTKDHFAWVTYTHPEVATFGLRETDLKDRGQHYDVVEHDLANEDRAIIDEYRDGYIKLFVDGKKLLGGTIVAPHAGEMVQELIVALAHGVSIQDLVSKTYPYPTASRAQKDALGSYLVSRSLTSWNKRMLRFLYQLFG